MVKRVRKKRKFHKLMRICSRFFIFFLIIFISVSLFKRSGLIKIRSVSIFGNEVVSKDTIKSAADLNEGSNFLIPKEKTRVKNIEAIPYVYSAKISYNFGNVRVKIKERSPSLIIKNKSYYLLDKDLRILEVTDKKTQNLLMIKGVDLEDRKPGDYILNENSDDKKKELLLKVLADDKLWTKLRYIELTDNISNFLTNDSIEIYFGTYENIDYKLQMLNQILKDVEETHKKAKSIDMERYSNPVLIQEADVKNKKKDAE